MTVAMPFLQKLITFLWPPDISTGGFFILFTSGTASPSRRHSSSCRAD